MRKVQVSMRIELFDQDVPVQFSIYADANDIAEAFSKPLRAAYDEISKTHDIGTFDEFCENVKNAEPKFGACEIYRGRRFEWMK